MIYKKLSTRFFVLIACSLFLVFSPGCTEDQKAAEKQIVEYDPAFAENLDKRNDLRNKILEQKKQCAQEKRKINEQIRLLKAKNDKLTRQNALAIENVKQQIEPVRRQLQMSIAELKREYDKALVTLAGINKDIREITKLVDKKEDLSLTQEELSTWNDRLSTLMKRRAIKESEMAELRREILIAKMKLKVMKI